MLSTKPGRRSESHFLGPCPGINYRVLFNIVYSQMFYLVVPPDYKLTTGQIVQLVNDVTTNNAYSYPQSNPLGTQQQPCVYHFYAAGIKSFKI